MFMEHSNLQVSHKRKNNQNSESVVLKSATTYGISTLRKLVGMQAGATTLKKNLEAS
jgi:hypothetical protein